MKPLSATREVMSSNLDMTPVRPSSWSWSHPWEVTPHCRLTGWVKVYVTPFWMSTNMARRAPLKDYLFMDIFNKSDYQRGNKTLEPEVWSVRVGWRVGYPQRGAPAQPVEYVTYPDASCDLRGLTFFRRHDRCGVDVQCCTGKAFQCYGLDEWKDLSRPEYFFQLDEHHPNLS